MTEGERLDLGNGFGRGALAVVVFEPTGRFAFKIFKSGKHPDHRDDPLSEHLIRTYFRSEYHAYRIASQNPELARHVPVFHGIPKILSVVDANGLAVTDHFLLDCCLQFERLCGQDSKLAPYERQFPHLQQFTNQLRAAGICHTLDASVFSPADAEAFKLIDFATRDVGTMS